MIEYEIILPNILDIKINNPKYVNIIKRPINQSNQLAEFLHMIQMFHQ